MNDPANLISRLELLNRDRGITHAKTNDSPMNWATRQQLVALLLLSALILAGCGGLAISFVSNQLPPGTATGTVVTVSLTSGNDRFGNPVTITALTLTNAGVSTTLNFCGNQESQFSINSVVQVTFTTGSPCWVLMKVVVLSS